MCLFFNWYQVLTLRSIYKTVRYWFSSFRKTISESYQQQKYLYNRHISAHFVSMRERESNFESLSTLEIPSNEYVTATKTRVPNQIYIWIEKCIIYNTHDEYTGSSNSNRNSQIKHTINRNCLICMICVFINIAFTCITRTNTHIYNAILRYMHGGFDTVFSLATNYLADSVCYCLLCVFVLRWYIYAALTACAAHTDRRCKWFWCCFAPHKIVWQIL